MFTSLLDVLFPPLCRLCGESERHLLCQNCLKFIAPPDPAERCRHCFAELPDERSLCRVCTRSPFLAARRAFVFEAGPLSSHWKSLLIKEGDGALRQIAASLLLFQWNRLAWPLADLIALIPHPGREAPLKAIAEEAAAMLGATLSREFKLAWKGSFEWEIRRKREDLMEGKNVLLLDFDSSPEWQRSALSELWPAFPSEVRILSLFEEKPT